jgi:uncharacterized repeat protein (TIGR03803 family)
LSKMVCVVVVFCATMATPSPAQTFTTLVTLTGPNGANPVASLIEGGDGNFYGTTLYGGSGNGPCGDPGSGCGTIYKITPDGNLTTLYSFCSQTNCLDGYAPRGSLVLSTDGSFYGTTTNGGEYNTGTFFRMTPTGTLTTLQSFQGGIVGSGPGGLIQASDGNFYGTAGGGTYSDGIVFRVTPSGTLTTLHSFDGTDGAGPEAGLVQATDGNLYGTTAYGGTDNLGTVFRITLGGTLTTLYSFEPGGADGGNPKAPLMQATNGNFYGTASWGGSQGGNGTIFEMTPNGTLTVLYNFAGTDGSSPEAGLIQATDGNFYGTTLSGGANGFGTVFQFTPTGVLNTLHSFDLTDGGFLQASLLQARNGDLYGAASAGSPPCSPYGVCGTVFSLAITPTPLQFIPVTPCRVVDTRQANGEFGGPAIVGGTSRSFPIPQNTTCNIPISAAAYSLNVTVVPITTLGYLTIWPSGESRPVVSTMNSPDGRVKANAAIVPSGGNGGAVSVYVTDTTNVILDIDGYFAPPGSGTFQFYPLTPCRIVDTRNNQDGGMLKAGVERDYTIPPTCAVPSSATAYSFNVTVLPAAGGLDYLTVWPKGKTQPVVSTLNDNTGTVVANAAIVPAGSENATAFYAHSNSTNLLVDIDGYFAAPGTGGLSLYPVAPCRVLDTRQNNGKPFSGEKTVNVEGSACAPPSNAAAYIFNATVVPPGSMPYLTLWPDGEQQPTVSTLNAYDGFITSNMAVVPTNNGSIDAYAAALTQLILDISGYFAP